MGDGHGAGQAGPLDAVGQFMRSGIKSGVDHACGMRGRGMLTREVSHEHFVLLRG